MLLFPNVLTMGIRFLSVLFCASLGLIESSSPPLQTSAYRKQHSRKLLPDTTRISEAVSPSKLSCSLRCSENVECKSFRFVVRTKVCQLQNTVPDATGTSTKHDCPLYYVRASVVETKDKDGQQALTDTWTLKTRILFTTVGSHTRLSQLTHKRNKSSFTTYRSLPRVDVIAMDYSPILKRIFLATFSPNQLISTVLDSTKTTSIRFGYYIRLTVDAENKLWLCARESEIHSMTTDGRLFKVVYTATSQQDCIKDVAVDSSAGMFFFVQMGTVSCKFSLCSIEYSGEGMQVYLPNSKDFILHLAFDSTTLRLVYNLNNRLKQFHVPSNIHSDLTSTDHIMAEFAVDQGIVYIMDGNTLKMFDRGTYKAYINLPQSDLFYIFCVIH